MKESDLQTQVADYLHLQYPDVLFHSDFGSGAKLTPGQAVKQKKQNGGRRAWPDITVAHPRIDEYVGSINYKPPFFHISSPGIYLGASELGDERTVWTGLYLELKKDGTKLIRDKDARKILKGETKLRKKGDWWDLHTEEQVMVLEKLRQRGYCAEFAVGFEEAKKIIDEYLGG